MTHPLIQEMEKKQLKKELPKFNVGDTVEVRTKVREGDKERIQSFIGTVIGLRGAGVREVVVVRRLVQGEGVERVIPLHSPNLVDIRVRHSGEVRRAKLYYLRDRVGKATRIKGRVIHEKTSARKKAAKKAETAEKVQPPEKPEAEKSPAE